MVFDSPQKPAVTSPPFAHWMGMWASAAGVPLASPGSEHCPGARPASQDRGSACHSTDPPGWRRGKSERLLAESEPSASKVGTIPFCSTFGFFFLIPAPSPVWVSGEKEGSQNDYEMEPTLGYIGGRNRHARRKSS